MRLFLVLCFVFLLPTFGSENSVHQGPISPSLCPLPLLSNSHFVGGTMYTLKTSNLSSCFQVGVTQSWLMRFKWKSLNGQNRLTCAIFPALSSSLQWALATGG